MSELQIICVDDAKALVRVGVPEPERATPQEVRVSVRLALQPPPSFVEADRIGATVDYDQIIGFIRDDLGEPAHLIETLADRVAGHCLKISARALGRGHCEEAGGALGRRHGGGGDAQGKDMKWAPSPGPRARLPRRRA